MNSSPDSSVAPKRAVLSRRTKPTEKSLARQFYEAAERIARVREGESLTESGLEGVPEADRAATQALIYGYLRAYGRFDAILAALLKAPIKLVWVEVLIGLALYRLQSRPESQHTVVNQAVEAVSYVAEGRFKALVNGVLRNYLRQQAVLDARTGSLAQTWQHPAWWVHYLKRDHPQDWADILAAGNLHPPMTLRINTRKKSPSEWLAAADQAGLSTSRIDGETVYLGQAVGVQQLPGFFEGEVSVQDAGAQTAAKLLACKDGEKVLDACAAPGGKTAHILELANVDMLALDLAENRCERVRENLKRLELQAIVRQADCADLDAWWDGHSFDAVLADVPCSASGVARRFPDIKWLRQESDPARFARTQQKILRELAKVVRSGGRMLYATCSVFKIENQAQIANFLSAHPEWSLIQEKQHLPSPEHDGFYYALLKKSVENGD